MPKAETLPSEASGLPEYELVPQAKADFTGQGKLKSGLGRAKLISAFSLL